jgi:hypothetical protein
MPCIGTNFIIHNFETFIQNGLKQGDALSPLVFNFALEYAIIKVQETRLLSYADADVDLLEDGIDTINKTTNKKQTP